LDIGHGQRICFRYKDIRGFMPGWAWTWIRVDGLIAVNGYGRKGKVNESYSNRSGWVMEV
jgi:hypothetical protein